MSVRADESRRRNARAHPFSSSHEHSIASHHGRHPDHGDEQSFDILVLDRALEKLAALDPEQARLVELRFFGGLTVEETAEAMAISPATVKRHWAIARAFLARELEGNSPA